MQSILSSAQLIISNLKKDKTAALIESRKLLEVLKHDDDDNTVYALPMCDRTAADVITLAYRADGGNDAAKAHLSAIIAGVVWQINS